MNEPGSFNLSLISSGILLKFRSTGHAVPGQRRRMSRSCSAFPVPYSEFTCSQQHFSSCGDRRGDGQSRAVCALSQHIRCLWQEDKKAGLENLMKSTGPGFAYFNSEFALVRGSASCGCWSLR